MIAGKTLGQRNFPKNIDFIPAQDRQEKSEQSSADPPESSEVSFQEGLACSCGAGTGVS